MLLARIQYLIFVVLATVQWSSHVKAWSITRMIQADSGTWQFDRNSRNHLHVRSVHKREDCETIVVESGDSCDSLAARCEVSGEDFLAVNDKPDLCSTLLPDQEVCCSKGTASPSGVQPGEGGICLLHVISEGESCDRIAEIYGLTVEAIDKYNKDRDDGWSGCDSLDIGTNICVSGEDLVAKPALPPDAGIEDDDDNDDDDDDDNDDDDDSDDEHEEPSETDEDDDSASQNEDVPETVPTAEVYPGLQNRPSHECAFFDPPRWDDTRELCKEPCKDAIEAKGSGTTSYGCVGNFPLDEEIPYQEMEGLKFALGVCVCNNELLEVFFDFFIEAMAAIAQIGCFILMQGLNFILNVATDLIPGGAALKLGIQGIVNAATYADYTYDSDNDPGGAFGFLLSPCGGTDLVPEDIKKGFGIAIGLAGGKFKGIDVAKPPTPKWDKGSGRAGDKTNPNRGGGKPTQTHSDSPKETGGCEIQSNMWLVGIY